MKIYYELHGDHRRPKLILINGLFHSCEAWATFFPLLTEFFHVLTYDSRGQGQSEKPHSTYLLEDHVSDLEKLTQRVNFDSFFLVGISNGARIALSYAQKFCTKVRAVVAADTYDHLDESLKLKLHSWLKAQQIGGPFHRYDVTTPWIWGQTTINTQPNLVEYFRNKANSLPNHAIEGLIQGALLGEVDVKNISCPCLILVGEEDILTPINIHTKLAEKLPHADLKIIPGGHASFFEKPENIKDFVVPFLKRSLS